MPLRFRTGWVVPRVAPAVCLCGALYYTHRTASQIRLLQGIEPVLVCGLLPQLTSMGTVSCESVTPVFMGASSCEKSLPTVNNCSVWSNSLQTFFAIKVANKGYAAGLEPIHAQHLRLHPHMLDPLPPHISGRSTTDERPRQNA